LKLLLDVTLPKEVSSEMLEIVKDLVLESATLRKSIEKLGVDPVEVRALAQEQVPALAGVVSHPGSPSAPVSLASQ
jgi:hypothetical protein